jgi:hypothetical protein
MRRGQFTQAAQCDTKARRPYQLLLGILLGLLILSQSGVRAQSVIDAFDPGDGHAAC